MLLSTWEEVLDGVCVAPLRERGREGREEREGGREGREEGREGEGGEGGREINVAAVRFSVIFSSCDSPMRGRRVG